MTAPRLILLAAGQGARLQPLTTNLPKSMQPINGEPLLLRTMRQLRPLGFSKTTVVVGYKRELISGTIREAQPDIEIVDNVDYEKDTNIWSAHLGLRAGCGPALIYEADVVISDACLPGIARVLSGEKSVWFTHGTFHSPQLGGILSADSEGRVTDLRYTPQYEERFQAYKKLLGLLFVGAQEIGSFSSILQEAAARNMKQYYMTPWCEQLSRLPCRECDLAPALARSFNTIEEYRHCCEVFV